MSADRSISRCRSFGPISAAASDLIYFHEADRGGHFAAWEQPRLFAEELRAAFTPLRKAEAPTRGAR